MGQLARPAKGQLHSLLKLNQPKLSKNLRFTRFAADARAGWRFLARIGKDRLDASNLSLYRQPSKGRCEPFSISVAPSPGLPQGPVQTRSKITTDIQAARTDNRSSACLKVPPGAKAKTGREPFLHVGYLFRRGGQLRLERDISAKRHGIAKNLGVNGCRRAPFKIEVRYLDANDQSIGPQAAQESGEA